ncbi:hypothetical protein AKO1_015072 [Acrasis kona]|uniref:Potassium channel tetramerisation-type BTB domain-containing protein n=1 Tax=Acrasis kona TaxID=1008807 RepID=A0AAW2YSG9_9EUKA
MSSTHLPFINNEVRRFTHILETSNNQAERVAAERTFVERLDSHFSRYMQDEKKQFEDKKEADLKDIESKKKHVEQLIKQVNATIVNKDKITLNVGGRLFTTTTATITSQENSFFSAMFSGMFSVEPEQDGTYFIDREPGDFGIILERLRGQDVKKVVQSLDGERRVRLLNDVRFYCLEGAFQTYLPELGILREVDVHNARALHGDDDLVLAGHTGFVNAIVELDDGRLASASNDKTIALWDTTTGASNMRLTGHSSYIQRLIKLRDGRLASASDSFDNTVRVWNPTTGLCEAVLTGHVDSVRHLVEMNNNRIASASNSPNDRRIRIWNTTTSECENMLTAHSSFISSLVMMPDGRLVSGSNDKTIKIFNEAGVCLVTCNGHGDGVTVLLVLKDGRLLSGSRDKTIKIWNTTSGACEATLTGHAAQIGCVTEIADSRVASSSDRTIKIWSTRNPKCLVTLDGHTNLVTCLRELNDASLVSAAKDKRIKIWNTLTGQCIISLIGAGDMTRCMTVLRDGRLACDGGDYSVKIYK